MTESRSPCRRACDLITQTFVPLDLPREHLRDESREP